VRDRRNSSRRGATTARQNRVSTRRRAAAGGKGRESSRRARVTGTHRASTRTSARISARTASGRTTAGAPPTDYKLVGMLSGGLLGLGILLMIIILTFARRDRLPPRPPRRVTTSGLHNEGMRALGAGELKKAIDLLEKEEAALMKLEREQPGAAARRLRECQVKLRHAREQLHIQEMRALREKHGR